MEEGGTTGVTRGAGEEGPHTTTTDRPRLLLTVDTTQMETGRKVDRDAGQEQRDVKRNTCVQRSN